MIAAGLSAGAAAGIPARHIIAQQAPPGIADAHGPVNKGLDLQLCRGVLPDGPEFLPDSTPGLKSPGRAQIMPGVGSYIVGNAGPGGNVALAVGGIFPASVKRPVSATITASTPASFSRSRCVSRRTISSPRGMAVDGAVDATPWAWATAAFSSSGQSFRRRPAYREVGSRQIYGVAP